jgi:rubredoxin
METPIDWTIYYLSGECPDCGEKIPSVAIEGDECGNCGHVFWLTKAEEA